MFKRTIGQLEETNQDLILTQKCCDRQSQELVQQIGELETKDVVWMRKVMQLEEENKILAEKVKNVELQKELAEKHEK